MRASLPLGVGLKHFGQLVVGQFLGIDLVNEFAFGIKPLRARALCQNDDVVFAIVEQLFCLCFDDFVAAIAFLLEMYQAIFPAFGGGVLIALGINQGIDRIRLDLHRALL